MQRPLGLARRSKDGSSAAALLRAANECARLYTELLQDVGLLDRRLGTLIVDDGKPVERTPTGEDLQRRFAEVHVSENDVMSEAERAYLHGDAAAAEAAAKDAV